MSNRLPFAMTQIWQLPFVVLYIIGLVMALSRNDLGRAQSFAAIGFGVLLFGSLLQCGQMYEMFAMRGSGDYRAIATMSALIGVVVTIVNVAGLALLMGAVFAKREPAPR